MRYLSTRDPCAEPKTRSFAEVLLAGLAPDGGLYVPDRIPELASGIPGFPGLPYAEVAARIVSLFAGDAFAPGELSELTNAAYDRFRHTAVAPLVQLDERLWLLELFHGPTLAFKDLALQLVGPMFDAVLSRSGEHVTMIGATSGDTGSAAIEACRDRKAIDIFILYPHRRVSGVQRRQMTTVEAGNAHAVAIEGTFDDCQDLVKAMFADAALRDELSLSAVNSINWARIAAQTVYYVAAAAALGAPARVVSFSVPTGNFGNVYAGTRRPPDGVADRSAGNRHQSQRYSRSLFYERLHVARRCRAEPKPQHGHSGVEQFRASAVRAEGPQRRRCRRSHAKLSGAPARCPKTTRLGALRAACFPLTRSTTLKQ